MFLITSFFRLLFGSNFFFLLCFWISVNTARIASFFSFFCLKMLFANWAKIFFLFMAGFSFLFFGPFSLIGWLVVWFTQRKWQNSKKTSQEKKYWIYKWNRLLFVCWCPLLLLLFGYNIGYMALFLFGLLAGWLCSVRFFGFFISLDHAIYLFFSGWFTIVVFFFDFVVFIVSQVSWSTVLVVFTSQHICRCCFSIAICISKIFCFCNLRSDCFMFEICLFVWPNQFFSY